MKSVLLPGWRLDTGLTILFWKRAFIAVVAIEEMYTTGCIRCSDSSQYNRMNDSVECPMEAVNRKMEVLSAKIGSWIVRAMYGTGN